MIEHNPRTIARPLGAYSHGIEVKAESRILYISGQVGVNPDGSIPETFEEQAARAWQNIGEVLSSAGMTFGNIVKMTTFMVRPEDYEAARGVRARFLGEHRPTSSAMVVTRLADSRLLVEIEAIAVA